MTSKNALLGATSLTLHCGVILMAVTIEDLEAQQQELQAASEALVNAADGEERDLTDDELASIETNRTKVENLGRQIAARKAASPTAQGQGRRTTPEPTNRNEPGNGQRRTIPAAPRNDNGRGGYRRFGDFAQAVHRGVVHKDDAALTQLANVATTYGSEGTGADGGFLVPPEFRRTIWQKVMEQENLLTRCDPVEIEGNNITVPKDETAPWDTTNGIQVYWESEGAQGTNTKPKFEEATMRLQKLMALVPVTEELLEDAPGLESWLRRKAPQKMAAKINTAIVRGTGVGQPLGILKAACLVSVAKETSQPADSVWKANVDKMWSRMYGPCRRNAVWLINQDIEPSLENMAFAPLGVVPTAASVPVYLPPGGAADAPYARLKSRPVIPVEACSTLGDQGDIILADLTQYMSLLKAGQDIRTDVSMHLYFDQALQCFRFIFRVNGQPSWGSTLAPENGTATRSCFVTLDAR